MTPHSRPTLLALFAGFLLGSLLLSGQPVAADEIPLDQRAEWFHHDRFGMFIHWGVYSVIGKGEWIQESGRIPYNEYVKVYPQFHPSKFDATQWVDLAKLAGQKYIIITTKHHDGFCMFDSKLSDYTIMRTPVKRDVCKELAEACHKAGIRIGFYYSIMDWHHPDYLPRRAWDKSRTAEGAEFDRYVEYMRGQIRELMTNYGEICSLWFDGGWERTSPEDLKKFRSIIDMARKLQPRMLVNDRANIGGDYQTPEQYIPATGVLDKHGRPAMWEVCMTMTTGHGSFAPTAWWGYDAHETVFKPTDELIQKLVDVASKGGNLLLNVGPSPDGEIRPQETERLQGLARWMDRHAEAIYGTTASPFRLLPFFGRVTQKGNHLFVHVFDWPEDRRLVLPGLKSAPSAARMLEDPDVKVEATQERHGDTEQVVLRLPSKPTDPIASVVALRFPGSPQVEPLVLRPDAAGSLLLPATMAEIRAEHGQRAKPVSKGGKTYIGDWSNPNDVVVWNFTMPNESTLRVTVDGRPASQEAIGQRIEISAAGQKVVGKITKEGVVLDGKLTLPGRPQSISVKLLDAKRTGSPVMDLFGVRLERSN